MKSRSFKVGDDFALSAFDALRLYVEPCWQIKKKRWSISLSHSFTEVTLLFLLIIFYFHYKHL